MRIGASLLESPIEETTDLRVAITGAGGFLGWHTLAAARENDFDAVSIPLGESVDERNLADELDGATYVLHLAGVNRGTDDEVHDGNVMLARQVAAALLKVERPPRVLVYANSVQVGNGSVYGVAKQRAADILADASAKVNTEFIDVRLPNLFGEHGRPFYNSVTATFCHLLAQGDDPEVQHDTELTLLHAQNAADVLLGIVPLSELGRLTNKVAVSELRDSLTQIARVYGSGEIPDVSTHFGRDLFNTYRSFTFPRHSPIPLSRHTDARGSFFETVRSHGGAGQSSFSTTAPGVTRGDHFHRRKIERFTVLSGNATIALRRLFTDSVVQFQIGGDAPASVDMPTMWAHNITNTGEDVLYTSFWTNELFDPTHPDTIPELVGSVAGSRAIRH